MKHDLNIELGSDCGDSIVVYKVVPIKNRRLRKALGYQDKVTMLIPGNSVRNIFISEVDDKSTESFSKTNINVKEIKDYE